MKCPVCKKHSLIDFQLEENLPAYRCKDCEGIWISAAQYWSWLKARGDIPAVLTSESPLLVEDVAQVKICPQCSHILRRYQVWPEVKFYLDHCSSCDSVWFDRDEWAVIKSRGQQNQIHLFFTEAWQQKLRAEEERRRIDQMYLERFGAEDYARIGEIRKWLREHPKGAELMAYLADKDPYRFVSD